MANLKDGLNIEQYGEENEPFSRQQPVTQKLKIKFGKLKPIMEELPEHVPPTKAEKIALALALVRKLGVGFDYGFANGVYRDIQEVTDCDRDDTEEVMGYMREILETIQLPPALLQLKYKENGDKQ